MKTKFLLIVMGVLLCAALWSQEQPRSPYFYVPCSSCAYDEFPLLQTEVTVAIAGIIADVRIKQVYTNNGSIPIEAIYIFPGATGGAVYDLRMQIGERLIRGVVREREQAHRDYEEARQQGKRASLLEQHRPNVFQMNVANILPGDTVRVELAYTEMLVPDSGIYEFVFPTVVGPRYSGESQEDSTALTEYWTSQPYLPAGRPAPTSLTMQIYLQGGVPVQDLGSPSHQVRVHYTAENEAEIELVPGEAGAGVKDFILRYRLRGEQTESGLLLYEGEEENYFLLTVQPPLRPQPDKLAGREYIFIVDVSGSMDGFPLISSKELMHNLLQALRPDDRFNMLLFAGSAAFLSPESLPATQSNIAQAIEWLDQQRGDGGTNMLQAVRQAMAVPKSTGFSRSFIILTDGYVDVEPQLFEFIRTHLGQANFFAFGIGASVNRHLIEGIAHVGMSEPFIVRQVDEAAALAEKFRSYIQAPVLTDISVDFGDWSVYDLVPANLPDLLSERPVLLFGKYRNATDNTITMRGRNGSELFVCDVPVAAATTNNRALRYLWARHRLQELADYRQLGWGDSSVVQEVTSIGLQYNLLTPYTSFVAVDTVVAKKGGELKPVVQPLPLPEGVPNSAIGPAVAKSVIPTPGGVPPPPPPEPYVAEIFKVIEEMPRLYDAGCEQAATLHERKACADKKLLEFVYRHFRLPPTADEVSGTAVVEFVVDKDGSIRDVRLLRDPGGGVGAEVVRVIRLMIDQKVRWLPGRQRGRPVAVTFKLPVRVCLE